MNYFKESKDNVFVAAHRGLSGKWPENTMVAFEKAMEAGCDQIETDVRVTKDGELVLIHDATVDRTSYSTGRVDEMTYEELQQVDVGKIKQTTGYKIPKLVDLLELVKDHPTMTLDIELKEYPTPGHEAVAYDVADRTLALIDKYGYADRIVLNTFNVKLQNYVEEKYGQKYRRHVYYPMHYMGSWNDFNELTYKNAFCVCMFASLPGELGKNMADPIEFEMMRAKYPHIECWAPACVSKKSETEFAVKCGCEAITTNYCDDVLKFLKELGKHE